MPAVPQRFCTAVTALLASVRPLNSVVRRQRMSSAGSLRYPPDFPPTRGWDRFFLGVRWLGPDLSFFNDLRSRQAQRGTTDLAAWGGGDREELARVVGSSFARYCGWPTPYFLPDDVVTVVASGPSFGWVDVTDTEEAIRAIEEEVGVQMGDGFWRGIAQGTMGTLVDQLLAAKQSVSGAGV